MLEQMQARLGNLLKGGEGHEHDGKFGTFPGVFTPTVLTILGAIMYLRLGQVVGNTGLLGAILIILLAHVITVSTGLAVSSVVTNTRVGAGGAFAIISQSLGLEVGGSVGIPLFIAQGISVALYVLAFAEAWLRIFPSHSIFVVSVLTFAIVFGIAYVSAQFAARIQYLILGIVGFSLISVLLASFPIAGRAGLTETAVLWGPFSTWSFWEAFAIFFPAVTGIMVGISLSGSLKEPRRSIPQGTMSAIGLTMIIYLLLTYWLAHIAPADELRRESTIMVDKAFWGWAILAGMLGATFSSALGSLVAAPRVMQALALHSILPFSEILARETDRNEPRPALYATGVIGLVTLLIALASGGLNAVASIITMFFLITYGMLNLVVLIEQMLSTVSFRPTFRVPRIVPFIGLVGCVFVMVLINPVFSLVAVVVVGLVYSYLLRRNLEFLPSDVRSGMFLSLAEWAATRVSRLPPAVKRTWKPSVLAPIVQTQELTGSYRFLRALAAPQGAVHALGIYPEGDDSALKGLPALTDALADEGIFARTTLLEEADVVNGVRSATQILRGTFFRPNLLFLNLRKESNLDELQELVDKTAAYNMGIVLLARHPVRALGRQHLVNVWISHRGDDWQVDLRWSNSDLALLLAYQLTKNWSGKINLCMAVATEREVPAANDYLQSLVDLARLPKNSGVTVVQASFSEGLHLVPRADLAIFGLPNPARLTFCQGIVTAVDGSCLFVRDSGEESALA
ncbi:amino acid permease [Candidatus Leptofilum sp.]|uniref:amino acid permease n=1 Tax=Candidatus Leptofilum sp. TaxID=3241576 RepID=UPI003B5C1BD5